MSGLNGDSGTVRKRQLLSGSFFSLLNLGVSSALLVISIPILLRKLGTPAYGVWVLLLAVVAVIGSANLALAGPVTKFVAEARVRDDSVETSRVFTIALGLALLVGVLATAAILMSADAIIRILGLSDQLANDAKTALRIIGIGVTPSLLNQVFIGGLAAQLRYGLVNLIQGAAAAALTLGAIIVVSKGGTIISLSVWTVVLAWATCLASFTVLRRLMKGMPLTFDLRRPETGRILRYSGYAWVSGLGSLVFAQADRILVGALLGPSAAARYAICIGLAAKINQVSGSLSQVLSPASSSIRAADNDEAVIRLLRNGARLVAYAITGLGAIIIIWSHLGLQWWLGPEFASNNALLLQLAVAAYVVFSLSAPSYWVLYGLGNARVVAIVGFAGAGLMVVLILGLVNQFGLVAAGWANFGYALNLWLHLAALRTLQAPVVPELVRTFTGPLVAFGLSVTFTFLLWGGLKGSVGATAAALAIFGVSFLATDSSNLKVGRKPSLRED